MVNNKYKKLKIVLIASLILNLAFISGFTFRKFLYPHVSKKSTHKSDRYLCKNGHYKTGFHHLCSRHPEFKKIFQLHKAYYQDTVKNLIKVKSELLNELEKKELDKEAADKLLKEINRLTNELNEKNYHHLLSLKELLDPEDFDFLLKRMCHALCTYKEIPCRNGKETLTEEQKNK